MTKGDRTREARLTRLAGGRARRDVGLSWYIYCQCCCSIHTCCHFGATSSGWRSRARSVCFEKDGPIFNFKASTPTPTITKPAVWNGHSIIRHGSLYGSEVRGNQLFLWRCGDAKALCTISNQASWPIVNLRLAERLDRVMHLRLCKRGLIVTLVAMLLN